MLPFRFSDFRMLSKTARRRAFAAAVVIAVSTVSVILTFRLQEVKYSDRGGRMVDVHFGKK